MKRKISNILIILFILPTSFSISCKTNKTLREKIEEIPAKKYENYQFSNETSLIERINVSSDIVLDYLKLYDDPNKNYELHTLTVDEKDILEKYLNLLPDHYQIVLKERLLGIYFIENLFGSGIADYVISNTNEVYSILILNPIIFKKNISELLTYKENTCYTNENININLEIDVSGEYLGLLYILLHECTHIIDYIERITPFVEPNMKELGFEKKDKAPFTEKYWQDYTVLNKKLNITYKGKLHFYAFNNDEKITNNELKKIYDELSHSPFVSIYSYYNWAEDFAEYMTFYYLTRVKKMNYKIIIYENKKTIFEYEPFKNIIVLNRIEDLEIMK